MSATDNATNNPHPTNVNLIEAEACLEIVWNDGHISQFPLRYLRGYCPCATCQGHQIGPPTFVETDDEKIVDVRPVGNYAMQVIWDSGHKTGLYSFKYLRQLCPKAGLYSAPAAKTSDEPATT